MATELRDLLIKEMSGVDDPAHGFPGFLVMKSRTGADVEFDAEDLAEAPDEVKAAAIVLKAYADATDYTPAADAGVKARFADRLRSHFSGKDDTDVDSNELIALLAEREDRILKAVEDRLTESVDAFEKAAGDLGSAGNEDEVASLKESLEATQDALSKTLDRLENVEKALTGSAQIEGQEGRGNGDDTKVEKSALRIAFERAAKGERVVMGRGD